MSYGQMPVTYATDIAPQPAAAKGSRVAFGNITNGRSATAQVGAKKDGVLTRAQARALKEKAQNGVEKIAVVKPKEDVPMVAPPVEHPVMVEAQALEAEALAEEVGEITLDPPALADELDDVQEVGVYINDIMRYFSRNESKYMPCPGFLKQAQAASSIDASARATLVDWVINVHRKFKLLKPVLPLAVNIIDRFLSIVPIKKDKLQLLGATALLIASKFEEIYPPEIEDFVHISDRAFKKEAVIKMEGQVLNALKFEVSVPTSFVFMSRFVKVAHADDDTQKLAAIIVDAALLEYSMLKYLPSVVVTSAIVLAQGMLHRGGWSTEMQAHTGYTKSALTPCIKDLVNVLCKGYHARMTSLNKKYGDEKDSEPLKKIAEAAKQVGSELFK